MQAKADTDSQPDKFANDASRQAVQCSMCDGFERRVRMIAVRIRSFVRTAII